MWRRIFFHENHIENHEPSPENPAVTWRISLSDYEPHKSQDFTPNGWGWTKPSKLHYFRICIKNGNNQCTKSQKNIWIVSEYFVIREWNSCYFHSCNLGGGALGRYGSIMEKRIDCILCLVWGSCLVCLVFFSASGILSPTPSILSLTGPGELPGLVWLSFGRY